jgi:MFS family permease
VLVGSVRSLAQCSRQPELRQEAVVAEASDGADLLALERQHDQPTLSFAVLLRTAAALGDRFGRRRLFTAGLGLFVAASAACAVAPVSGPFVAGVAYASSDSIPDQLVTVNVTTGGVTPFVRHLQTAKGLVYLDASGSEPVLSLGQSSGGAAAAGGSAAIPAASVTKQSSDGDALPIVLAIVALVLAAGFGAYSLTRRSSTT